MLLGIDDSAEGVEPQDKQDSAYYLAPCMMTLLVLLGAVYRTMNNPRLGCVPWCKKGSTRIQALFKYLWYGAGLVPWWSQGSSTLIRGTAMFLLAVWEQVVDTTMVRTSANEKRVVDTTVVRTLANEKLDVDTVMVRMSNEK